MAKPDVELLEVLDKSAKLEGAESVINKIITTVELLTAPAIGVGMVWGFDVSILVGAIAGGILSLLSYVKVGIHNVAESRGDIVVLLSNVFNAIRTRQIREEEKENNEKDD